jgi:hypothetical protein
MLLMLLLIKINLNIKGKIMRFILTLMWLFGMTWLGYWIGGTFFNGSDIAFAIGFFVLAVIIRLMLISSGYSGGSSSSGDSGFLAFLGCDGDGGGGGSGGGCSGGSSCGGGGD